MISFDSVGIDNIDNLRSELCSIPKKDTGSGLFQILSKADMKKLKIQSPNMADVVMMLQWTPKPKPKWGKLNYKKVSVA
jgi:hypothetical protein